MGRSRKPRGKLAEEIPEFEDTPEEVKTEPTKKQRTHFTALLKQGTTYEFEGMVFYKGIPKQVEMKYIKKFQTNGWFTITQ